MKQLLLGTVILVWDIIVGFGVSCEFKHGTAKRNVLLFAGKGGNGLLHVSEQYRGWQPRPGTKLNAHTAEVFLQGWRWEFVLLGPQQRQSSSAAPLSQRWRASAVLWAPQTDEDLWDLSQLLLGKDDACYFITLYTLISIYSYTPHLLWTARGTTGATNGDNDIAVL